MSPDSQAIQLVAIGAAVLAAVALAVTWTLARGWWRAVVRTGCAVLCVATAAAAGLVWVNRQIDFYPTWASLLGNSTQAAGAAPLPDVTLPPAEAASHGAGRIETFTVAGKASKLTLPMYAYLPPGYDTHPAMRYPVVEALHGYPGTPLFWMTKLGVTAILDKEIAAGRMAPTVVLFPYQTPAPLLDTECTNLVGGPQAETFLTQDVPAFAAARLHVRSDPGTWGLIGYSAGAYCASDLLLRHPAQYAAAASLSGYADPGIKVGDGSEHTTYNDAWRLAHLPVPAVALYLACAKSDPYALRGTQALAKLAHYPLSLTTAYVNGGGHNSQTWEAMEAPAFDWLSTWLGQPITTAKPTTTAPKPHTTAPSHPTSPHRS
jgi:enterochelin esterase-like enzyme